MTLKAIVSDQEKHRTQEDKREETQRREERKGSQTDIMPCN
jgi:hypothetical protein